MTKNSSYKAKYLGIRAARLKILLPRDKDMMSLIRQKNFLEIRSLLNIYFDAYITESSLQDMLTRPEKPKAKPKDNTLIIDKPN